jgi:hypothetical protein
MKSARVVLLVLGSVVSVVCVAFGLSAFRFATHGIEEHYTAIRIDVGNDSGAARLRFSYCDGRRDVPQLHLVEVFRLRSSGASKGECLALQQSASDRPLPEWRLGAPIVGFRVQGCDGLPAGDYRASVLGAGQAGSVAFRLAADGSAVPTSPPCR